MTAHRIPLRISKLQTEETAGTGNLLLICDAYYNGNVPKHFNHNLIVIINIINIVESREKEKYVNHHCRWTRKT